LPTDFQLLIEHLTPLPWQDDNAKRNPPYRDISSAVPDREDHRHERLEDEPKM